MRCAAAVVVDSFRCARVALYIVVVLSFPVFLSADARRTNGRPACTHPGADQIHVRSCPPQHREILGSTVQFLPWVRARREVMSTRYDWRNRVILLQIKQELISRLDSRTLPLEPRHRCTSSVLYISICLRNDVLARCLLTKHAPDDVIVTHTALYDLSIGPIFNDLERLDFKVTPRRWI